MDKLTIALFTMVIICICAICYTIGFQDGRENAADRSEAEHILTSDKVWT